MKIFLVGIPDRIRAHTRRIETRRGLLRRAVEVVIPVEAGRNIAVLLEAAVRNTILQLRGIDTLANFMERQQRAMGEE